MGLQPIPAITRLENSEKLLSQYLRERIAAPFVWGQNDCILFAADAVMAMTGTDLAADYRGTYSDEAGAAALLESLGGIESLITNSLGIEPHQNWRRAFRGDVVLIDGGNGRLAAAIVADKGEFLAAARPMNNERRISRRLALKVWNI